MSLLLQNTTTAHNEHTIRGYDYAVYHLQCSSHVSCAAALSDSTTAISTNHIMMSHK